MSRPPSPSSSSATAPTSPAARRPSRARWPSASLPFHDVTVFTTCARDYVTWRNELPAGEEVLGGVRVRRFPVEHERDLAAFNAFAEPLYAPPATHEEEHAFLGRQGPVAPALVEALRAERGRYAAVVFFTYLYYPTYWGLRAAPERPSSCRRPTTSRPCASDLPRGLRAPAAFAFLTPAEQELVRARFGTGGRPAVVAGMGVDPAGPGRRRRLPRAPRPRAGPTPSTRAASTPGRAARTMLAHHERYRREQEERSTSC